MPRDVYVFDLTTKPLHNITLDHFDCGISRNQPCKWGIEWDLCASTYLNEESHLEASL